MGWEAALQPIGFFLFYQVLKRVLRMGWRKFFPQNVEEVEEVKAVEEDEVKVNSKEAEQDLAVSSKNPKKKGTEEKKKKKEAKKEMLEAEVKKSKKKEEKKKGGAWKAFAMMGLALCAVAASCSWGYYRYGPLFFWSHKDKFLHLTTKEWDNLLSNNRKVLFVGGHHRSGTTVIWRAIASHPKVAWFGEEHESGLDFSEGSFAQDVYPRFGIGAEFGGQALAGGASGGIGKYALGAPDEVLWTEEKASLEAQLRVLNSFGFYWKRSMPHQALEDAQVYIEKSPPNVVLARYLQALIDLRPDPSDSENEQTNDQDETNAFSWEGQQAAQLPGFIASQSRASFLFITRHPLANALSHQNFPGSRWLSTAHLLGHWLAVEHYAASNAQHLSFVYRLKLESFATNTTAKILDVWQFLQLIPTARVDQETLALAEKAAASVRSDPNAKYRKKYCDPINAGDPRSIQAHQTLIRVFGDNVRSHGYDLAEFCQEDGPLRDAIDPPATYSLSSPAGDDHGFASSKHKDEL